MTTQIFGTPTSKEKKIPANKQINMIKIVGISRRKAVYIILTKSLEQFLQDVEGKVRVGLLQILPVVALHDDTTVEEI